MLLGWWVLLIALGRAMRSADAADKTGMQQCGPWEGNCPADQCCSAWGTCGTGRDHCNRACLRTFSGDQSCCTDRPGQSCRAQVPRLWARHVPFYRLGWIFADIIIYTSIFWVFIIVIHAPAYLLLHGVSQIEYDRAKTWLCHIILKQLLCVLLVYGYLWCSAAALGTQALSRLAKSVRGLQGVHSLWGALLAFVLSQWVNKAHEKYGEGKKHLYAVMNNTRYLNFLIEKAPDPAAGAGAGAWDKEAVRKHLGAVLFAIIDSFANGNVGANDITSPQRFIIPRPETCRALVDEAECFTSGAAFTRSAPPRTGQSPNQMGVVLRHLDMLREAIRQSKLRNGTEAAEWSRPIEGIRDAYRDMVAISTSPGQHLLHSALVIQLLLYIFIYSTPVFYIPYDTLGRLITVPISASPEDGFFLGGSYLFVAGLAIFYHAIYDIAKRLDHVYGDDVWQLSVKQHLSAHLAHPPESAVGAHVGAGWTWVFPGSVRLLLNPLVKLLGRKNGQPELNPCIETA